MLGILLFLCLWHVWQNLPFFVTRKLISRYLMVAQGTKHQWRLVAHHGDVRESTLISILQVYFYTDLPQLAPSPPWQPVTHASQWLFRWKMWWKSHQCWVGPAGPWRCHQAGCRAPGRRVPSRHFLSALQPGQRGQKCTHAEGREKRVWKRVRENSVP